MQDSRIVSVKKLTILPSQLILNFILPIEPLTQKQVKILNYNFHTHEQID